MDNNEIKARVKIDSDPAGSAASQKEISDIGNAAEQAGNQANKAAFDFKSFATNAGLGATAILGMAGAAVVFGAKTAGNLESARQGFVALLGSADKADATMARIKKEAAATPFTIPGLVTGTQALTAITKDGDKAIDMLMDVGKAVSVSGKGQAELDRVVFNLQQISSTGKVTAMDIRQFQSAIPIFNDIVEGAGMTVKQIMEADNAAELLGLAFKRAGEKGGIAAAGFTAQAGTFNQLVSNMSDAITIFASDFVEQSGIFDVVKNAVLGFTEFLQQVSPQLIAFAQFVSQNSLALSILAGIITALVIAALVGLVAALWPVIVATTAVIALGAAFGAVLNLLWPVIQTVTQFLAEHHGWLVVIATFIGVLLIPVIWTLITAVATMAITFVASAIPAIIATIIAMWPIILVAGLIALAVGLLYKAWQGNWGNIRGITESVANFIIARINKIITGINMLIKAYDLVVSKLGKNNLKIGEIGLLNNVSIDKTVSTGQGAANGLSNGSININQFNTNNSQMDFDSGLKDIGWMLKTK